MDDFYWEDIICMLLLWYTSEAVVQRCSVKKMFLEISQNSQENICAWVSFSIKLQAPARNFIKSETLAQVFSCEFCNISKNAFSCRTPPVAASVHLHFRTLSFRTLSYTCHCVKWFREMSWPKTISRLLQHLLQLTAIYLFLKIMYKRCNCGTYGKIITS